MNEMTLGQKIRELRLARQMTQKELAGDFITRNMLSQIENDSATPSMKTMEYLSAQLDKPIGYFLDKGHGEVNLSHLIAKLIEQNESGAYEDSVKLLEQEIEEHPNWAENKIIMDLYVNSHMYLAGKHFSEESYETAREMLLKILKYEKHLLLMTDVYLYKVYDMLAEACSRLGDLTEARDYYDKGRNLINRLVAAREVQSLYLKMMEGETDALAESIAGVDTSTYDAYSLARFQMIAGTSMYRKGNCHEAIEYLEKALAYYSKRKGNSVTAMLYEQLSKCYSELEDYKKAYDYLQKSQEIR